MPKSEPSIIVELIGIVTCEREKVIERETAECLEREESNCEAKVVSHEKELEREETMDWDWWE